VRLLHRRTNYGKLLSITFRRPTLESIIIIDIFSFPLLVSGDFDLTSSDPKGHSDGSEGSFGGAVGYFYACVDRCRGGCLGGSGHGGVGVRGVCPWSGLDGDRLFLGEYLRGACEPGRYVGHCAGRADRLGQGRQLLDRSVSGRDCRRLPAAVV